MYLEEPDQLLEQVPSPIMDGEEGGRDKWRRRGGDRGMGWAEE